MQIADALDYLHHHDPPIVHQDIRCVSTHYFFTASILIIIKANILVNNNKEAVLADFGLSRLDRDMFNNFASTVDDGCLRWRAPELMFPEDGIPKPSPASDMWAFGMVIYVCMFFTILVYRTLTRGFACVGAFIGNGSLRLTGK